MRYTKYLTYKIDLSWAKYGYYTKLKKTSNCKFIPEIFEINTHLNRQRGDGGGGGWSTHSKYIIYPNWKKPRDRPLVHNTNVVKLLCFHLLNTSETLEYHGHELMKWIQTNHFLIFLLLSCFKAAIYLPKSFINSN